MAITALAGSTGGIGGTSTSAAPIRLRERRPAVVTLRSDVDRRRWVRAVDGPPRVKELGLLGWPGALGLLPGALGLLGRDE
jgi:hypothetical protein